MLLFLIMLFNCLVVYLIVIVFIVNLIKSVLECFPEEIKYNSIA